MINLFIALILYSVSSLALFAMHNSKNDLTKICLGLVSIFYSIAALWKIILFFIWLVKYLF